MQLFIVCIKRSLCEFLLYSAKPDLFVIYIFFSLSAMSNFVPQILLSLLKPQKSRFHLNSNQTPHFINLQFRLVNGFETQNKNNRFPQVDSESNDEPKYLFVLKAFVLFNIFSHYSPAMSQNETRLIINLLQNTLNHNTYAAQIATKTKTTRRWIYFASLSSIHK